MFRLRILLLPVLALALLVLSGALSAPPAAPARLAAVAPAVLSGKADPAAVRLLDRALEAFEPRRLQWLETAVWQQVQTADLAYQAEGSYRAGPERRFRLDLRTRFGSTDGQVRVVCDGRMVREATRIGDGAWTIAEPVDLRAAGKGSPDQFLRNQLAGGPPALLRELRQQLVWARQETVRRQGRRLYRLTALHPAVAAREPAPAGSPRQARLYLDVQTLWPCRLEWWGPDPRQAGDALLLQMELRGPVLNRPLSAEQCATAFALDLAGGP